MAMFALTEGREQGMREVSRIWKNVGGIYRVQSLEKNTALWAPWFYFSETRFNFSPAEP